LKNVSYYHRTVGTMPLAEVVFAEPSVGQIWSRNRVQSWTPTMMFGSSTVTLWVLLSKLYGPTMTISTVCVYKKEFQLLQKVLKAHSTY